MMNRLLIITQKVDKEDAVLGFFHRWLEEFAKHLERVDVICLYEGTHALPSNVSVHSLGKERGYSKIRQLFRFWKFCFALTPKADGVFVHMNAVYVPLNWLFWKLEHKKVFLWRNHPEGGLLARLAYALADRIFYTSPYAHASRSKRSERMPAGIDAEFFRRDERAPRARNSILCLGRISPVKHLEEVIEAARMLERDGVPFSLTIAGSPANPEDIAYEKKLRSLAEDLEKKNLVRFVAGVTRSGALQLFNAHEVFVNATPTGSFDKTVLEAMACGALTLVSNRSFSEILPEPLIFSQGHAQDLAGKLERIFNLPAEERAKYRMDARYYVERAHGLSSLVQKVLACYAI